MRSHFKHSVELVDDNGEIVDQLAGVQDFMLARATYDAAVRRWPKARIRLCQEARIIEAAVSRIEQRGAVAFTGAGIAAGSCPCPSRGSPAGSLKFSFLLN